MAIIPIHKKITKDVLSELGFSEEGREVAANANAEVDDHQGNHQSEANLHAMRGFSDSHILQSADEAQQDVGELLRRRREETIDRITQGAWRGALAELGRALHTVQDRAYHRFEPWPYEGLVDSVINPSVGGRYGLAPNYMLCHALRDLSYVSVFDMGAAYTSDTGWNGRLAVELTRPSENPWVPHVSLGGSYRFGSQNEVAGGVTLTWGATPRSLPRSGGGGGQRNGFSGRASQSDAPPLCEETAQGGVSLLAAIRDSRLWVANVRDDARVTVEAWRQLREWRG